MQCFLKMTFQRPIKDCSKSEACPGNIERNEMLVCRSFTSSNSNGSSSNSISNNSSS